MKKLKSVAYWFDFEVIHSIFWIFHILSSNLQFLSLVLIFFHQLLDFLGTNHCILNFVSSNMGKLLKKSLILLSVVVLAGFCSSCCPSLIKISLFSVFWQFPIVPRIFIQKKKLRFSKHHSRNSKSLTVYKIDSDIGSSVFRNSFWSLINTEILSQPFRDIQYRL